MGQLASFLGRPDTSLARGRQLAAEGSTRAARSTGPEGGAAGALARQVELRYARNQLTSTQLHLRLESLHAK